MLRLPQFEISQPETIEQALVALRTPGSRIVAGGTDILPNLKHYLDQPPQLVHLGRVEQLRQIVIENGVLRIGAGVTLTEVSEHPEIKKHCPSLASAAGVVASPLIRNMGTIGGNVNLDTRCRYVNQTAFWRESIGGGCLKSEGNVCHVVPRGRNCVAAMSSDTAVTLVSLDAEIVQVGPKGQRVLPLIEYYGVDGVQHLKREEGEITTELRVPISRSPRRAAYAKWSVRKSIDFPLVSVALRFDLKEDSVHALVDTAKVVVGVLNAKPRVVSSLDMVHGKKFSDSSVAQTVSEAVFKQCKPLENVPYEAAYRRQMLKIHTRRAIENLVREG